MTGDFELWYGKALIFARLAHGEQKRKYTGEPYVVHCRAVAELVESVFLGGAPVNAALLHDTIEDTSVTAREIEWFFGKEVADLVVELTDVPASAGNRATRKQMDRDRLAKSSPEAASIKLADLIDNTKTIVPYDVNFAVVYLREKRLLLPLLKHGCPFLYSIAEQTLLDGEAQLQAKEMVCLSCHKPIYRFHAHNGKAVCEDCF